MLDIKKLAKVCAVQRYQSQSIVFKKGDPGKEMFIIIFGSVRVFITDSNGQKVEIDRLKAGDIFGEMSLLESLPRSVTVETLEETATLSVNANNFETVIRQEPSLAMRLMKILCEYIRVQNIELAKYKDQAGLNSGPSDNELSVDNGPQVDNNSRATIVETEEDHRQENITEGDDFRTLIRHLEKYDKPAPQNHSEYLFDKKILCPVCRRSFEVKHIRYSKLRLEKVEPDYRQVYTNFDPLWYVVWVCPYCYYANFTTDFPRISDRERKQIMELSNQAKDIFGPYLKGPLSLTQVLTGYYLMLFWFQQLETVPPDLEKSGKFWLRLSWLFNDMQEMEMTLAATRKALEYFTKLLNVIPVSITDEQVQYLYLLVGELSLKSGNKAEAKIYFHQSLAFNGGNVRMKKQAQNRILDLKKI